MPHDRPGGTHPRQSYVSPAVPRSRAYPSPTARRPVGPAVAGDQHFSRVGRSAESARKGFTVMVRTAVAGLTYALLAAIGGVPGIPILVVVAVIGVAQLVATVLFLRWLHHVHGVSRELAPSEVSFSSGGLIAMSFIPVAGWFIQTRALKQIWQSTSRYGDRSTTRLTLLWWLVALAGVAVSILLSAWQGGIVASAGSLLTREEYFGIMFVFVLQFGLVWTLAAYVRRVVVEVTHRQRAFIGRAEWEVCNEM